MVAGRFWLIAGALLAARAVAAGAFGAHALRSRLSPADLATFETAARYQMYHALGLIAVAGLTSRGLAAAPSGWCFLIGIVLFSGSLYLLTLGGLRWMGAITPLGGVAFILGWMLMAVTGWRVLQVP
jgi:uncharacterized membrane protein YgdD (TMEM256/DUF423 family)